MSISRGTTPAGLLLAIRSVLPGLNEQEHKVGQYVLEHPAEAVYLSMTDLATRCTVSDTTVFRLGARVAQVGLIDVLYTFMAVKRQSEVEHNLARISEALYRRQG